MAAHARGHWIVSHWVDLRETSGSRWVVLVAQYAEITSAWDIWFHIHRCRDMIGRWTMTGFAIHTAVVSGEAGLLNRAVAQCALMMTGVLLLARNDGVHGGSPVVSDVSKGVRHQEAPRDDQREQGDGEHR
jgi:hypothetical protein